MTEPISSIVGVERRELLELAKRYPPPPEWYEEEWPQYAEAVKHIRQALAAGVPLRDIEGALDQEENHG